MLLGGRHPSCFIINERCCLTPGLQFQAASDRAAIALCPGQKHREIVAGLRFGANTTWSAGPGKGATVALRINRRPSPNRSAQLMRGFPVKGSPARMSRYGISLHALVDDQRLDTIISVRRCERDVKIPSLFRSAAFPLMLPQHSVRPSSRPISVNVLAVIAVHASGMPVRRVSPVCIE